MTPGEWERVCHMKGLMPIKKFDGPEQIYIAEGFKPYHANFPEPHWLVVWALGTDEKMDIGRELHFPQFGTTQADRVREAKEDAEWHRRMSRQNKRFEAQGRRG